jgi:Bromodomain
MTALEADLKRMVQNAKEFNASGSRVYEDAERIRKALSNFMPKHNPAYKDLEYRALPAPIPDDNDVEINGYNIPVPPTGATMPATIKLRMNGSTNRKSVGELKDENAAARNENMQQEQLKIVEEMIELRDPE